MASRKRRAREEGKNSPRGGQKTRQNPQTHLGATPDFSTYLDRVKRGQAAIGKAAAVPILIGPNTLVGLAKPAEGTTTLDKAAAVKALVPHYEAVLKELKALGVPEVQMHEPILASQTANDLRADFEASYATLSGELGRCFFSLWSPPPPPKKQKEEASEREGSTKLGREKNSLSFSLSLCSFPFSFLPPPNPDPATAVGVPINLVTYYDDIGEAYSWAVQLPVAAVSLDFLGVPGSAHKNATAALIEEHGFPKGKRLGAGVVDGRSVWADGGSAATFVAALLAKGIDDISVQSSVSLQHLPYDVELEKNLPEHLQGKLAFAAQKVKDIVSAAKDGPSAKAVALNEALAPVANPVADIEKAKFVRELPFDERRDSQIKTHAFPTTSIGSFPQTPEIRRARLAFKKGQLSAADYEKEVREEGRLLEKSFCVAFFFPSRLLFLIFFSFSSFFFSQPLSINSSAPLPQTENPRCQVNDYMKYAVEEQERIGIDVLVHGEPERTDMVEYFGQKLEGFTFTDNGWVQSYGSRYVRPPIIHGESLPFLSDSFLCFF